jgi:hypothetical protein
MSNFGTEHASNKKNVQTQKKALIFKLKPLYVLDQIRTHIQGGANEKGVAERRGL